MGDKTSLADKNITTEIIENDLRRMPISQINWPYSAIPGQDRVAHFNIF